MFKLLVIAGLIALAHGYSYGMGGSGYGGGYGDGYGAIQAAVLSHHQVKYYDVPSYSYIKPVNIEVGAQAVPINMLFHSKSSHLNLQQYHEGQKGSYQESYSQDEPHYLKHTVKKPVYQEVYEVITPYRKITQEIKPVHEEIQTLIAKKSDYGGGYGGGYSGGYGGGMGGGYGGHY